MVSHHHTSDFSFRAALVDPSLCENWPSADLPFAPTSHRSDEGNNDSMDEVNRSFDRIIYIVVT